MRIANKHPEVSTWMGTAQEVRHQLNHHAAQRLLVISFDHIKPSDLNVVTEAFVNMSAMVSAFVERRNQEFMEKYVDLLVPRTPASPHLLREANMLRRARSAVLDSGDLITASQIAEFAGFSTSNASAQPNKWKKLGQIFAVHHNGVDYFPGYGLDADAGYRPLKPLAQVIQVFDGIKDAWGLAYWFGSSNSFLGGRRPQDVLKVEPERVIAAARDEVEEVAHG